MLMRLAKGNYLALSKVRSSFQRAKMLPKKLLYFELVVKAAGCSVRISLAVFGDNADHSSLGHNFGSFQTIRR